MTDHSPDQRCAINAATAWYAHRRGGAFRLEGAAGTGKSTCASTIALRCAPGSTAYLAPTGKAAAVLRSKGCDNAATVHSQIYAPAGERTTAIRELEARLALVPAFRPDERRKLEAQLAKVRSQPIWTRREPDKAFGGTKPNLIVLDEASMVDDRMWADLASFDIPVLALGDPYQLPPVAGPARWRAGDPDVELTTIHRGADTAAVLDLSVALRAGRPTPRWNGKAGAYPQPWSPADLARYDQVIVGRNATRWQIVEGIRDHHGRPPGQPVPGDRIICLRNDPELDVVNGQQATVTSSIHDTDGEAFALEVVTDAGETTAWLVDARGFEDQHGQDDAKRDRDSDYVAATFAQAVTCHSAQGSQWPRVAVIDESAVFRQAARAWRYTACTRAELACVVLDPGRMMARRLVGAAA